MADLLLLPFTRWVRAPVIETPISTIQMPSTYISVPICVLSFFVITSGTIYCFVNNMPMSGYYRDDRGRIRSTWMSEGLSNQYLAEGLVAALTLSAGACALIAAYQVMGKEDEELTGVEMSIKWFGVSAPLWAFFTFHVFRMKIPSYFPMFAAR